MSTPKRRRALHRPLLAGLFLRGIHRLLQLDLELLPAPARQARCGHRHDHAFSQLGNVAGSYVWDLKENGYRKSYGIVLAMFGVTIAGCYLFRMMLQNLNSKLEAEETAEGQDGDPRNTRHRWKMRTRL